MGRLEEVFKNPYDDLYYKEYLEVDETDGFQEWNYDSTYLWSELSLVEFFTIPICFLMAMMFTVFSMKFAMGFFLISLGLILGFKAYRKKHGEDIFYRIIRKYKLLPFPMDDFMPFDPPIKGVFRFNVEFIYNEKS